MSPLHCVVVLCAFSMVYGQINGREVLHVPRFIYDEVTKASVQCMKETGVSQEVVDNFFNTIVTPDMKTKTFMYCFGRKVNTVDENGLLNDNFISLFNDNQHKEEAQKVMDMCNSKRKSKYDTVFESVDCFYKNSPILPLP